ncbi:MAG: hypothetical protein JXQ96_14010 [Cyclobacteriaceae bacterium]
MKTKTSLLTILLVCVLLPAYSQKLIMAFDLSNSKSTLNEKTKSGITSYYADKIKKIDCIKIPGKEEREKIADASGNMIFNWAPNQRMAEQMTSTMKVNGYITASVMNERGASNKTRISIVYHEKGKPVNYWYTVVDNKLDILKKELDNHMSKICGAAVE